MSRARCAVPATLEEAHDMLWRQRPAQDAPAQDWAAFHRHSASVYTRTSEVDRRHHYEALQCAGLETRKAEDIEHAKRGEESPRPE